MNEMPKPLQVYIVEDSQIVERFLAAAIAAAGAHTASVDCMTDTSMRGMVRWRVPDGYPAPGDRTAEDEITSSSP